MIKFAFHRLRTVCLFGFFLSAMVVRLHAAQKTLVLSDIAVLMEDISSDVEVNYYAMRLNRPLNAWNVEVSVRNKSSRAIQGPIALYIESFSGTTGPRQPDGTDGAKAYYDLSNFLVAGGLPTGQSSTRRTLTKCW